MPLLWKIALEGRGQDGLDEAYDRFFTDTPCPVDIVQHREHESLFLTWLALRFAPATRRGPRIPSAAAAALAGTADDAERGLSPFEARFLAAAEAASPSFYLVAAVAPGEWMDLEDVMTGSTCRVLESAASRTIRGSRRAKRPGPLPGASGSRRCWQNSSCAAVRRWTGCARR